MELNQLREELDTCIQQQEFGKAAEIKAKVTELEARKTELMEQEQPQTQEVREEKVSLVMWCTICDFDLNPTTVHHRKEYTLI